MEDEGVEINLGFWSNFFKNVLKIPSLAAKGVTEFVG
jgi:hypothetical protein